MTRPGCDKRSDKIDLAFLGLVACHMKLDMMQVGGPIASQSHISNACSLMQPSPSGGQLQTCSCPPAEGEAVQDAT